MTIHVRAAFNLSEEYKFVYVEIRTGDLKSYLTTQKAEFCCSDHRHHRHADRAVAMQVPVVGGTALLDFFARIPCREESTRLDFQVHEHVHA